MTARLELVSPRGTIDLDGIAKHGKGVQVQAGVTGLGLPSRDVQYYDGAGDGATFRSYRVLPRDVDLPLYFLEDDREGLKASLGHFSRVVSGTCELRLVDAAEVGYWSTKVQLVGGGDYAYGIDTIGSTDLQTVVTFRAGDPFWTRSYETIKTITNALQGTGLLNGSLVNLNMSSGQAIGTMTLDNDGDATAFPVWKVYGPGTNFSAKDPVGGRVLKWLGTLAQGETLTIDTKAGTVTDQAGANRYADLDVAPAFWQIPPGSSAAEVQLEGTSTTSRIECLFRPRKAVVI